MKYPKLSLSLVLLVSLLPLTACAYSGGPLEGKVLEEGTNKPISGAIVVARWQGDAFSFVDSPTVCIHVESTTTDNEGRYHLPAWRAKAEPAGVHNIEPILIAYQPGYGLPTVPSQKRENVLLKPFAGTRGERLEYLGRVISSTSCGSAGASYKNLYRLRRAVYEEAIALAQTPEEKKRAERFKEIANDTLVDRSKPTKYDERGRLINVDPKDTFRPEDLK